MANRTTRASVEEENAPLLRDSERDDQAIRSSTRPTYGERVDSYAQEPLTPLTKILLVLGLVLLLTTSVFIGLFAGAQHRLKLEHDGKKNPSTTTTTSTVTSTLSATTTVIKTTTSISTTTIVVPPHEPTPTERPCVEPHCIVLSASILSSLDHSQDPCENFYEFANGGWLAKHPLPADKSSYGNFEALAQQNQQVIQKILELDSISPPNSYDRELLKKLRDFYSSCLDEDALNKIGTVPLHHFVQTVRNLYAGNSTDISSESKETLDNKKTNGLTAALAFLHSRGVDALFSFSIEGDVGVDPNHMSLWFSQSDFGLPSKEYYEEVQVLDIYRAVVVRLLTTLDDHEKKEQVNRRETPLFTENSPGAWPPGPWPPWEGDDDDDDDKPGNDTGRIRELAKKVVDFEQKVARASLDLDILYQDPIATYNPVPLSNLTGSIPQIHFPTYFSTFTPRSFPERVIITYPAYSAALSHILSETDSAVIEAYLVVRAALALSPHLGMSTEAWQAQRSLLESLTGIKKGAVGDRAEYCVGKVEKTLGFAAGRYFVNETFAGDSKEKGTKVITDIVKAFKASLKNIDWMDEESSEAAAKKADAIRVKVGYPISPDTQDPRSLARYYASVKVSKNDFFGNMLSSSADETFKQWLQLGRQRNLDAWEMFPSTVNAYFNPPSNEIVFPAGILQPPFFSRDWPNYLAYGAFGQVASHELTHAFDSAGRLYNPEGKLEQWWTNATSEGFQAKQDCIIEQYSSYYIEDGQGRKVHVNGNLTSGENIGDTGLIQAYRAWKAQYPVSKKEGNEYLLPGLQFTRDQLFFLAFGQIWARAMKPAAALQRIRTDPHSPSRFRVDGTVSNIPEFAAAFKCSKKAKLNPPQEDRCIFWG